MNLQERSQVEGPAFAMDIAQFIIMLFSTESNEGLDIKHWELKKYVEQQGGY